MSRKKSAAKRHIPPRLKGLFRMTPEQLAVQKRSGAGVHKSGPKYKNRSVQKRQAIVDQVHS